MAILLKTASDRVSSIQIMQVRVQNKGKSVWKSRYDGDVSPTDLIYPAPPSSFDIAIARNPNQFGLTDRDLGLTEMGLQTLCFPS